MDASSKDRGRERPQLPVPRRIRKEPGGIEIDWDGAGHVGYFPARALRLACPCAGCIDEMSGRALLDADSVPADVHPVSVELVGAYGLKVRWSDGHGTGIYTFQALRRDCPCDICRPGRG